MSFSKPTRTARQGVRSRPRSNPANPLIPQIPVQTSAPGIVLEFNEANQVVGIEMHCAPYEQERISHCLSKRSPNLNLSTLEFITA